MSTMSSPALPGVVRVCSGRGHRQFVACYEFLGAMPGIVAARHDRFIAQVAFQIFCKCGGGGIPFRRLLLQCREHDRIEIVAQRLGQLLPRRRATVPYRFLAAGRAAGRHQRRTQYCFLDRAGRLARQAVGARTRQQFVEQYA